MVFVSQRLVFSGWQFAQTPHEYNSIRVTEWARKKQTRTKLPQGGPDKRNT